MIPHKTNQKSTKKRAKKSRSDHHNGKTTKTHREMTQSDFFPAMHPPCLVASVCGCHWLGMLGSHWL